MASELVGQVANVAPMDLYPKWPTLSLSWSGYTSLPSSYSGKKVSYNDSVSGTQPLYSSVFDATGLNAFGLSAASSAFSALQSISPLTFTKATTSASASANIHFGAFSASYSPTSPGGSVGAYSAPGYQNVVNGNYYTHSGDVWIAKTSGGDVGTAAPTAPDLATATLRHELGHVLGLADTGGLAGFDQTQNNQHFSIMSYVKVLANNHWVSEYQLYDVAAIQRYYGRNMSTASGSTTYLFSSFLNSAQPTDTNNNRYYSLWDAGGTDTIDLSAVSTATDAAFVDLRPGHFSSIGHGSNIVVSGGAVTDAGIQNISLAFGTVIEGVIGTGYNDVLVGSALTTSIKGGAGNDQIYGSGSSVRLATTLGATVGVVASDDGDYGYFDATGYHARTVSVDVAHNIDGGAGSDAIFGSNGGDTITGGYGSDYIYGGLGDDIIDSGLNENVGGIPDQDRIESGAGNDTIYVRAVDSIDAGSGNDIVHVVGGSATGTLGDGNDSIDFANGISTTSLDGGNGNDKFTVSDASPAVLSGGAGDDYYIISGIAGVGLEGGAGNDLYDFTNHGAGTTATSQLVFYSGWGHDTIRPSTTDGYVHGGATTGPSHWHIDTIQFTNNSNSSLTIEWNPIAYNSVNSQLFGGSTTYYAYGDLAIFDTSGNSLFFGSVNGSWTEDSFLSTFSNTVSLDIPNINSTSANGNNFTVVRGDPTSYNSYPGSAVPSPWTAPAAMMAQDSLDFRQSESMAVNPFFEAESESANYWHHPHEWTYTHDLLLV